MSQSESRLTNLLASIPLATRIILCVNIAVYIYSVVSTENLTGQYAICAYPIIDRHEFYRLITSAYFHLGLLHILFNSMSFFYLGIALERRMGTACLFGIVALFSVLVGCMYVLLEYLWEAAMHDGHYYGDCAVGFSGIIFALIMIETAMSNDTNRSVFGMCQVPAWVYPWLLLIIFQFLFQSVSFVGHLAGILVGWLYIKGLFNWATFPRSWIQKAEQHPSVQRITHWSIYAPCPSDSIIAATQLPCITQGAFVCPGVPAMSCGSVKSLLSRCFYGAPSMPRGQGYRLGGSTIPPGNVNARRAAYQRLPQNDVEMNEQPAPPSAPSVTRSPTDLTSITIDPSIPSSPPPPPPSNPSPTRPRQQSLDPFAFNTQHEAEIERRLEATRAQQQRVMEQLQAQSERTRLAENLNDVINRSDTSTPSQQQSQTSSQRSQTSERSHTSIQRSTSPTPERTRTSRPTSVRADSDVSTPLLESDFGYDGYDEDDVEMQHVIQQSRYQR